MQNLLIFLCLVSSLSFFLCPVDGITFGDDADVSDWRYQCSLQYQGVHVCGCIVVDHYWVLTGAHCIETP